MIPRSVVFVLPLALTLAACGPEMVGPEEPVDSTVLFSKTARGGRAGALGVVYVSSQGLYYDTFVSASSLPMQGRFQKLEGGVTEFGPGDPGYLGGRWWVDENGNDVQDPADTYLLCPLLGPGRTTP
jgi:hypothetical protein